MDQPAPAPSVLQQITEAVRSLRYGTVQITVHNARVVQIEKVERVRVNPSADLTPGRASLAPPTDRTSGAPRQTTGR